MYSTAVVFILAVQVCVASYPNRQSFLDYKLNGCNDNYNPGVLHEFGPLPPLPNFVEIVYPSDPDSFQGRGYLNNFFFKYMEFQWIRDVDTADNVYAYYIFAYRNRGVLIYLDYLRVDPEKWEYVSNAILTVDGPDDDGIISIRYLMSDCRCRMREYDLNEGAVLDKGKTLSCDGQFQLTNPAPPAEPKRTLAPGCERGNNPGIYNFKISNPSNTFVKTHIRKPSERALEQFPYMKPFSIVYGSCRKDLQRGTVLPLFCMVIKFDNTIIDYIKIKRLEKENIKGSGIKMQRGYDYAQALKIQPVAFDGQTRIVRIKFLMDDCTCTEREYLWRTQRWMGLQLEAPVTLRCEDFGARADSALWAEPSAN